MIGEKKKTDRPRFNCPIFFCRNDKSMSESQVRILLVIKYSIDDIDIRFVHTMSKIICK